MIESRFDGLTRHLGRRGALQALGAAAVATVSGVSLAGAKKGKSNGKKNRKNKQKLQRRIDEQALALCAGQVTACVPSSRRTAKGTRNAWPRGNSAAICWRRAPSRNSLLASALHRITPTYRPAAGHVTG